MRALRAHLDLSQAEAAARCGVKPRTWISWENGQATPGTLSARLLRLTFPAHKFPA